MEPGFAAISKIQISNLFQTQNPEQGLDLHVCKLLLRAITRASPDITAAAAQLEVHVDRLTSIVCI